MTQDFNFVEAVYRSDPLPMYRGNPYIEALPAIPDDLTLFRALMNKPTFSPSDRDLSASQRIALTGQLQNLFVPLPRVLRFARAMLTMLFNGYIGRAPFTADDRQRLQEVYALQQDGKFISACQNQLAPQYSMALLGTSGSGKSFTTRHVAGLLPPVIFHQKLGRWQLPFIFIEMAYDGQSVHTLASSIAAELDRLMPDGQFLEAFKPRQGANAEQRLLAVLKTAYKLGVGGIIVDEVQNQQTNDDAVDPDKRRKTTAQSLKTETPLTKLLVTFSNMSHLPVIFTGTTESKLSVSNRFTRARRMSGRGSGVWEPLERSETPLDDEFGMLMKALFHYQWTTQTTQFNGQWGDTFFEFTQGVPDVMVKLYESTQVAAISGGHATITPELVEAVFRKEFRLAETGITYLKNKDRLMLDIIPDLLVPETDLQRYSMMEVSLPVAARAPSLSSMAGGDEPPAPKATTKPAATPTKKRAKRMPRSPEPIDFPEHALEGVDLRPAAELPNKPATMVVPVVDLHSEVRV